MTPKEAANIICDFKNYAPDQTKDHFPHNTAAGGIAGLLNALFTLFESSDTETNVPPFTPCFKSSNIRLVTENFVEGLVVLGWSRPNYGKWLQVNLGTTVGPAQMINIERMCEVDEPPGNKPLPLDENIAFWVMYLTIALLKSKPTLLDAFVKHRGFDMLRSLILAPGKRSPTVQKLFCQFIGHFQTERIYVNHFTSIKALELLTSLSKSRNAVVRMCAGSFMGSLSCATPKKQRGKSAALPTLLTDLIEAKDIQKNDIAGIINDALLSSETAKDEFCSPAIFSVFLKFLVDICTRENLQSPGEHDGHSATWWTVGSLFVILGSALQGSEERQAMFGELHAPTVVPLMLQVLEWIPSFEYGSPSGHILACMFKSSSRSLASPRVMLTAGALIPVLTIAKVAISVILGKEVPEVAMALPDELKKVCLRNTESESTNLFFSFCLGVIAQILHVHVRPIPQPVEDLLLFPVFCSTLRCLNSSLTAKLSSDLVISTMNFLLSCIICDRKCGAARCLSYLQQPVTQGQCYWPSGSKSACNFVNLLTAMFHECQAVLIHPSFHTEQLEKFQKLILRQSDALLVYTNKLTWTPDCLPAFLPMKAALQALVASTPGTFSGSRSGKKNEQMCSFERCSNRDNLQACAKCRKVRYCGTHCQKLHWPFHKQECKLLAASLQLT